MVKSRNLTMYVFLTATRVLSPERFVGGQCYLLTSSVPLLRRGGFRCHDPIVVIVQYCCCTRRYHHTPSRVTLTLTRFDGLMSQPSFLLRSFLPSMHHMFKAAIITAVYYHLGFIAEHLRLDRSQSMLTPSTSSLYGYCTVRIPTVNSCSSQPPPFTQEAPCCAAPLHLTVIRSAPGIDTTIIVAPMESS